MYVMRDPVDAYLCFDAYMSTQETRFDLKTPNGLHVCYEASALPTVCSLPLRINSASCIA